MFLKNLCGRLTGEGGDTTLDANGKGEGFLKSKLLFKVLRELSLKDIFPELRESRRKIETICNFNEFYPKYETRIKEVVCQPNFLNVYYILFFGTITKAHLKIQI